jgi:trk system potassium uptake protein TrkH
MMLRMFFRSPGMLIGALIMAINLNPSLSIILAVAVPILLISIACIIVRGFPLFGKMQTKIDGLNSTVQENLTNASASVSLILMIIGGSPVGTAGGVKTVTVAVLFCSALATIKNKNCTTLFGRRISDGSIRRAVAVFVAFITICGISTILLMATNETSVIDAVYETVSATATVGLSRSLTPELNNLGKMIIIVTMYFGRVGPISMAIALGQRNETQNLISEPTEEISIG